MGRLGLLALVALGCVAGGFAPPLLAQRYAGPVVRCESPDFRDNYCPADTRAGVRLVQQRSRASCIEGETWGYDRRGIWVTGGCEGDFVLGVEYRSSRGTGGYGPPPRVDRPHGPRGGAYVVCESRDFRYRHCPAPVRRDVDLVRQFSRTECRYGRTWGYDRLGVWVDRGCAAEFVVY